MGMAPLPTLPHLALDGNERGMTEDFCAASWASLVTILYYVELDAY